MNPEYSKIVEESKTPYHISCPVLGPTGKKGDFDSDMVGCSFIFRNEDKWYMMYVGFDGKGYRTGLAESDDLITWKRLGLILDWSKNGSFDSFGAAGIWILREPDLNKPFLQRYHGKYWLFYNSYN